MNVYIHTERKLFLLEVETQHLLWKLSRVVATEDKIMPIK